MILVSDLKILRVIDKKYALLKMTIYNEKSLRLKESPIYRQFRDRQNAMARARRKARKNEME